MHLQKFLFNKKNCIRQTQSVRVEISVENYILRDESNWIFCVEYPQPDVGTISYIMLINL